MRREVRRWLGACVFAWALFGNTASAQLPDEAALTEDSPAPQLPSLEEAAQVARSRFKHLGNLGLSLGALNLAIGLPLYTTGAEGGVDAEGRFQGDAGAARRRGAGMVMLAAGVGMTLGAVVQYCRMRRMRDPHRVLPVLQRARAHSRRRYRVGMAIFTVLAWTANAGLLGYVVRNGAHRHPGAQGVWLAAASELAGFAVMDVFQRRAPSLAPYFPLLDTR